MTKKSVNKIRQPQYSENPGKPAGFWIRVTAALIDRLTAILISMVAIIAIYHHLSLNDFVVNLIWYAYSTIFIIIFTCMSQFKGSLGHYILGIQVVRPDGERIGIIRSLIRYFAEGISQLILGIGYLMIPFTAHKRALHDFICDTRVVYRQSANQHVLIEANHE